MLEFKKVYIDTRFKTIDSKSNSEFRFELPDDVSLGPNTRCYVDDITIPVTWYSIETNINDKLYFRLLNSSNGIIRNDIITLASQNYDLDQFKDTLQTILNDVYSGNKFVVENNKRTNLITININNQTEKFEIFTDDDLRRGYTATGNWTGSSYDKKNLQAFNYSFKNTDGTSPIYTSNNPFVSGFVDFLNIHNVYIYSYY